MLVEFRTTLGQIADDTLGIVLSGDPGKEIKSITTDSREPGMESLFVPIVGEKFDGHQFIESLVKEKNIAAFLTMKKEHSQIASGSGVGAVLCYDTLKAYGLLALKHRKRMKATVIGITGTNGKTTTKEMIWSILSRKSRTLKNEKNYNNEIGVPYTLLGIKDDHKWAVIEMGMNHRNEISLLSGIAVPDIALITNVGEGHLESLGRIENVALAKSEIMDFMEAGSLIILNRDTKCFDILYNKAVDKGINVKTFGLVSSADIKPSSCKMQNFEIQMELDNVVYNIPLYGLHNIYNAAAAIAVATSLGIESDIIKESLSDFKNVDMRSQIINNKYTVINDTYNSNPLSSKYALISLKEVFGNRRKIAIFSDMKELGKSSILYHEDLGKQVYVTGVNLLFTWGELALNITDAAKKCGMNDDALHFKNKSDLISAVLEKIKPGDVILVKGSRSMKMEEVVEALLRA